MDTTFAIPRVMDWTIIPSSVIARAWLDQTYADKLLLNPEPLLQNASSKWPRDKSFVVVRDSKELRHLVLPAYKAQLAKMADEELEALIADETGGDERLEFFLPARVIRKCFRDSQYKARLIARTSETLKSEGYDTGDQRYKVLENTDQCYHLVLPNSPSNTTDLDFDALRDRLIESFGTASSGCCASGTCDND